ncbi:MAG: type II secretion system protein [Propionicimonas sp.]|nr:type II secretion system protein [Propionicimonas sp.]
MRATITRYLEALKKRRSSDEGFSLIELIVVVAILGILVAIAIPVFGGIQQSAKDNSLKTAAANGATVVASQIARKASDSTVVVATELAKSDTDDYTYSVTPTEPDDIADFCVTATAVTGSSLDGGVAQTSGPSCT